MDFFELLKQGKYYIEKSGLSLWGCWDNSRVLYLKPDNKHGIWLTYNTETLLIYTVLMTVDIESEEIKNNVSSKWVNPDLFEKLSFRWMNPKTLDLFKNDENYITSYHDNEIMIEDENDMDFITLKLKYT